MCEVFDVRSSSSSYFVLNRSLNLSSFIHNCFPLELKSMSVERGIFYTLNLKRIQALSGPAISPVPPLHAHVLFDVTLPSYAWWQLGITSWEIWWNIFLFLKMKFEKWKTTKNFENPNRWLLGFSCVCAWIQGSTVFFMEVRWSSSSEDALSKKQRECQHTHSESSILQSYKWIFEWEILSVKKIFSCHPQSSLLQKYRKSKIRLIDWFDLKG